MDDAAKARPSEPWYGDRKAREVYRMAQPPVESSVKPLSRYAHTVAMRAPTVHSTRAHRANAGRHDQRTTTRHTGEKRQATTDEHSRSITRVRPQS